MKTQLFALASLGILVAGAAASAAGPTAYSRPGRTDVVATGMGGARASYPTTDALQCSRNSIDITPDGRYVVFDSSATNLVPNDSNALCDVFRLDRRTGKTVRVSVAADGSQALAGNSSTATVSADGRYVAFESNASNLIPGNTNLCVLDIANSKQPYCTDIYVKDLVRGTVTRVSVSSSGKQASSGSPVGAIQGIGSYEPSISSDGQAVTFQSRAVNFGDATGHEQIYRHDLRTRRTEVMSRSSSGAVGNSTSESASISGNGRYVVFESAATNFVARGLGDAVWQVYVHDARTGVSTLASVASDGSPASFGAVPACRIGLKALPVDLPDTPLAGTIETDICESNTLAPNKRLISDDGRYVVFSSNATNLVPNDRNLSLTKAALYAGGYDVFVHDMVTKRTDRLSVDPYGHESTVESVWPMISANGRYVSFGQTNKQAGHYAIGQPHSPCGTRVLGMDQNLNVDASACNPVWAMLADRLAGTTELVDVAANGKMPTGARCSADEVPGSYVSYTRPGRPTSDGRFVPFWSNASDLRAGSTSACQDYLRDRGPQAGIGGFGSATPGGSPSPEPTCVVEPLCLPPVPGDADLIGVRAAPRASFGDVFVRWDVHDFARLGMSPAGGTLYGLRFTSGNTRFELRAQRVGGSDFDVLGGASFGLFRESVPGVWARIASLKGGYGTVGDSVVTAVPLSMLGGKSQLTDVTAYTAVGSYMTGPTKVLDSLRLTSRAGGR